MDGPVSPVTGNPLVGSHVAGWTDSATGQFFTDDEISGGLQEPMFSPLDLIGGGGLIKGIGKGIFRLGEKAAAKLLGKDAVKAAAKCKTCTTVAKKAATKDARAIRAQEEADPEAVHDGSTPLYRGDTRSPDEIRNAGGFSGHDPSGDATLLDHMAIQRPPSQWVSATTDPEIGSAYAQNPFPLGATGQSYASEGGWMYHIDQPGGVIVDNTTAFNPMGTNSEVAFSNGIPWNNVTGWQRVDSSGSLGNFVTNPSYVKPP